MKLHINDIGPRLHGTGSPLSRYQFEQFQTRVNPQLQIILQNLIQTTERKGGRSKHI